MVRVVGREALVGRMAAEGGGAVEVTMEVAMAVAMAAVMAAGKMEGGVAVGTAVACSAEIDPPSPCCTKHGSTNPPCALLTSELWLLRAYRLSRTMLLRK